MRAAKKQEDDTKGAVISIYVPRVSISPRSSAALRSHLESRRSAEVDAAPVDHADSCNAPEAKGIPAKLLAHDFIDNLAADTLSAPKFATSPPATLPNRRSPSPPPQPSSPARDVGGTVYYKPPLQSHTHTSKSDLLVHRLKSFLPSATRPPTRACKVQAQAGSGAEAVKLACNGPALDRFPLSVQGGLTSDQVKRAHTPAYEPRVAGQERQPLTQTWLVPNPNAKSETSASLQHAYFLRAVAHSLISCRACRSTQGSSPDVSPQRSSWLGGLQTRGAQRRGARAVLCPRGP